jgi:hypothetical protein
MRFLLDENLEREVFLRLKNDDHEVRHVGLSDHLSKGASDSDLAAFSREHRFNIVTHDDDFRDAFSEDEFHAVLYFPDQTLSAKKIADALDEISVYYDQSELHGFVTIGQSWL